MEQNHSEVAAMIADYQDNGPQALERYEKKRSRPSRDNKVNDKMYNVNSVKIGKYTKGRHSKDEYFRDY